ncbi:RNA polymerase sigma factor [Maribacter sp. 2307UL18-2]|uniref:RNA polymerase sigma factor n=1 Tax=Maribacter sp. 2307UL18-2 TaxID=3386274 RepID=UPI0039BD488F
MEDRGLIPELFRTEFSKIVAVLCKTFGLSHIELAEDLVSDTFLKAAETWGLKGVPDNPKAWLYTVAKNKAKDTFRRQKVFQEKIQPELMHAGTSAEAVDIDLSEHNIKDSQLQMLFAVCNPLVSAEAQISLALRILCGFSIPEIATAFLSTDQTINKRLYRAKEKLRKNQVELSMPSAKDLDQRLQNVLLVLYLLFSEGYYSSISEKHIRKDLCIEAMRLTYLLLNSESTNLPKVNALMALFCFHASRFDARTDADGGQIIYDQQNEADWDLELIEKGNVFLNRSGKGDEISKYHLEAIIAYWHTQTALEPLQKWEHILQSYNRLLQLEYSPMAALNRTYALARARGKKEALQEALKIDLKQNHLYHLLLAELYEDHDSSKYQEHLEIAAALAKTENERNWILDKLARTTKKN